MKYFELNDNWSQTVIFFRMQQFDFYTFILNIVLMCVFGCVSHFLILAEYSLTLLHSEWQKLHRVLAVLSAKGLNTYMNAKFS